MRLTTALWTVGSNQITDAAGATSHPATRIVAQHTSLFNAKSIFSCDVAGLDCVASLRPTRLLLRRFGVS
jgi:hypothetical protein